MSVYRVSNTAPHSLEGQLHINLDVASGGVQIYSDRALQAHRILIGKSPEEALQLVPRLFGICANSHTLACHLALRNAGSNHPQPPRASALLVQLEVLREGLMRLLRSQAVGPAKPASGDQTVNAQTDLTQAIQATTALGTAIQHRHATNIAQNKLSLEHSLFERVLRLPAAVSARITSNQLQHEPSRTHSQAPDAQTDHWQQWLNLADSPAARMIQYFSSADLARQGAADNACQPLPAFKPREIAAVLQAAQDATRFVAQPTWAGRPHETGTLARLWRHPIVQAHRQRYGTGLLTRSVATVLELFLIANAIRTTLNARADKTDTEFCESPVDGLFYNAAGEHKWSTQPAFLAEPLDRQTGSAIVEAARGRLVHIVQIYNGTISDYRILAPTEWNCHPLGPLWQALRATMPHASTQRAKSYEQQDHHKHRAEQQAAQQSRQQTGRHSSEHQQLIAEHLIQAIDPCVGYQLRLLADTSDQPASGGAGITRQSSTVIEDDPDYA